MDTAIIVAVIGLVGPAIGYVIARQAANDRRANTARDLETLTKLDPATETARQLDQHIKLSIARYIRRDQTRDAATDSLWSYLRLVGVLAAAYGLIEWIDYGVPDNFRWGVYVALAGFLLLGLWLFAELVIGVIQLLYEAGRNIVLRRQVSKSNRTVAKLKTDSALLEIKKNAARELATDVLETIEQALNERETNPAVRAERIAALGSPEKLDAEIAELRCRADRFRHRLEEIDAMDTPSESEATADR